MDRIRLEPESTSAIRRVTNIVEVTVKTVQASEWRPVTGRLQQRDVQLTAQFEQVFKGRFEEHPSAVVALEIIQSAPRGARVFAVPGAWSGHELTPGARFVIFGIPLESPVRVELAATAVPDLLRAQRAGSPELSISATLAASASELEDWGYLFAQYLEARLPETFFRQFSDFETFLKTIEAPQLSAVARRIMLAAAYTKLMLFDPAPPLFINRLLATTARVLDAPYGVDLREGVLETYLPNLLGITGGLERKSAHDILAPLPAEREVIERFVTHANDAAVLAWMKS